MREREDDRVKIANLKFKMKNQNSKFKILPLVFTLIALTTCDLRLTTAFAATSTDRVEALMMGGDYAAAALQADAAIRSHSGRADELYYLKGLSELKLDRFADARQSFGAILKRHPGSKKAFDARVGIRDAYML